MYRVLVGKPEGRRPLGRSRRRWVDNIRTDLQEVGCGYMDWIGLAQDRDRWRTLVDAGNFLTSCKPVSFSKRTLHHGVNKYIYILNLFIYLFIYLLFPLPCGAAAQSGLWPPHFLDLWIAHSNTQQTR